MRIVNLQVDGDLLLKYYVVPGSAKGEETYEFFKLKELETNTFDRAQGEAAQDGIDALPPNIAADLRALLSASGEI